MSADTRVVSLIFDNEQFKDAVEETLASLEKLNEALNKANNGDSLSSLASKTDLSPIERGVTAISSRFSTLGVVGMTVIQRLTNAGIDMVGKLGSGFKSVINQIETGGFTRAANLEQAKFLLEGLNADVEGVMERVNEAVTDTAYGLDEAAKAAASFYASGITDLDQLQSSLTAVSGAAAMTGDSYANMAEIFTTVAGQGKLMTEQLRMFEGRGLNVAALLTQTADKTSIFWGKTEEEVRDMVTKGLVDFDSFSSAMDELFGEHAKDANKTFSGSLANMKTALSRFGEAFYTPAMQAAVPLFNSIKDAIASVLGVLKSDGNVISSWTSLTANLGSYLANVMTRLNELGAFEQIGQGLSNIFYSLVNIVKDLSEAFESVFGTVSIDFLNNLAKGIQDVLLKFRTWTAQTDVFVKIFTIFFNVIKTAYNIISGFVKIVATILGTIENSTGVFSGILSLINSLVGGMAKVTSGSETLSKTTDVLSNVFEHFGTVLKTTSSFIKDTMGNAIENINNLLDVLIDKFDKVLNILGNNLTTIFSFGGMASSLSMIGGAIKGFLNLTAPTKSLGDVLKDIGGTLNDILKAFKDGDVFSKVLSPLTEQLAAMQKQIKADAIEKIAIALFLMAAAMMMLASLDAEGLAKGLAGLTGAMGVLIGGYAVMMKIMESVASFNNTQKGLFASKVKPSDIAAGAASMILIAGAILILAKACTMLAGLDVEGLAKGLSGVVILLGAVFGFLVGMSKLKVSADISKSTGIALIAIATALLIMAKAVEMLGGMDIPTLAKGLGSIVVLLGAIFGFMVGMSKLSDNGISKTLGLTIMAIATGLLIMSKAVETLSALSLGELAKGLGAIAVFMGEMVLVCLALSKVMNDKTTLELGKVGLAMIAMSAAMWILSKALSNIASIGAEGLVSSLLAIGSALMIFASVAQYMNTAESGAKSMIVMAVAVGLLAASLKLLSSMSLADIGRSLLVLAGALVIMAGVASLLSPLEGVLTTIATATLMMGGSIALVGAGILMLSTGLSILATTGSAAISTLISMLSQLLIWLGSSITDIAKILVTGLVAIFNEIVAQAPTIIASVAQLIGMIISAINENIGKIVDCGVNIVLALLEGLSKNMETISSMGATTIVGFINGLADNMGPLIDAAMNLGISFINGLADGIRNNADAVRDAILNLCSAILEAFMSFFGIASPSKVMKQQGVNFIQGLINGIKSKISNVVTTLTNGMSKALKGVKNFVSKFLTTGVSLIANLVSGIKSKVSSIATTIGNGISKAVAKVKSFVEKFISAGKSLITGVASGIRKGLSSVISAIGSIASKAISAFKSKLKINSPSKVFAKIAESIPEGIAKGINKTSDLVTNSVGELTTSALSAMGEVMERIDSISESPVITPVLDLSGIQNGIENITGLKDSINATIGNISMNTPDNPNADVVKAIGKLRKDIENINNTTYVVDGVTYDDGSNITSAVETLVRATKMERRV